MTFSCLRSSKLGGWENISGLAPLATPETLSEASSDPPSPIPPPRPMRRTPKIPGNLSTAADDLKNNLHFAMLSAKNYFLHNESSGSHSSGNSEASYESAKSVATGIPPPVPRRRDSVIVRRYEWVSHKQFVTPRNRSGRSEEKQENNFILFVLFFSILRINFLARICKNNSLRGGPTVLLKTRLSESRQRICCSF